MSPVPSRYVRAIYLLPGVKCESQAKREKRVLRKQRKKRTIVGVVYKGVSEYTVCILYGNWSHAYCTVVLLL